MRTVRQRSGISRTPIIAAVVLIVLIIAVALLLNHHVPSTVATTQTLASNSSSFSSEPTTQQSLTTQPTGLSPPNSSLLVDDSQIQNPDSLDPALAFSPQDEPILTSVYQELVEFNGSSISQVIPALASSFYSSNGYKSYEFVIRSNVTFSNGDKLTPAAVWFSFVRELYEGQAVGISDYQQLTLNLTTYSSTGYAFPWGIRAAIQAATGLPALSNSTVAAQALNNILSNFNASNSTIEKIMAYPNQAYVVTGSNGFRINLLKPYVDFPLDIASWWGAIVDPAYVDEHGGVQGNQVNTYFNIYGGPGTGPYEIVSVGQDDSSVTLKINPHYWDRNGTGFLQAGHIEEVVMNFGLQQNDRLESFDTNQAQISYVDIPFIGQLYDAYAYKSEYSLSQIFHNFGSQPGIWAISMNTQIYPTSNNYFRLAVVHAINFSLLLDKLYTFNGTPLAEPYLGPVTPQFGSLYDPSNIPPYSYDPQLAIEYLNLAGEQEGFSVTLPNGTVIGNTSAPPLPQQTIVYLAPASPVQQSELQIIASELSQIGIDVGLQGEGSTVAYVTWSTPQTTPALAYVEWLPDWPDPILQMMAPLITTTSLFPAWMNVTNVNQILSTLPFTTNTSFQIQEVKQLYNTTYWYAPYAWLPFPATYLFAQPYVNGLTYNPFVGYSYNELSYN
jgi:peptide/nickel transport system substrate-binding protein